MYEGFDIWAFLAGLPLGLVIWGIVHYFMWKKGKKERMFDERYTNLHRHARAISWKVMTVAILIAWIIVMIVEGAKLAFFICLHCGSFICSPGRSEQRLQTNNIKQKGGKQ